MYKKYIMLRLKIIILLDAEKEAFMRDDSHYVHT